MTTLWRKNYQELAAAGRSYMYSAVVTEHEGVRTFNAYPNRGDICTEYVGDDAVEKAEEWLRGTLPAGFYSASF